MGLLGSKTLYKSININLYKKIVTYLLIIMLRFFTTWNLLFILYPRLVKYESRGLLTLSSVISAAGLTMIYNNYKTKIWKWKNITVNKFLYFFLEISIHQIPFFYMLKQYPTGNAFKALIPTCIYISLVNNPYKINGKKLKNYYGPLLVCLTAPIINFRGQLPPPPLFFLLQSLMNNLIQLNRSFLLHSKPVVRNYLLSS